MKVIRSMDLVQNGARLIEHLNEDHDRGEITKIEPLEDGTVRIETAEGTFYFYNRGKEMSEGIRLEGDRPRYGLIR